MIVSLTDWNHYLSEYPNAHFLQMGAWGELKSHFGWKPLRIVANGGGAQVLFRNLPLGFTIAYIPKGPIAGNSELYDEIQEVCRKKRAVFLKIEPNAFEGDHEFDCVQLEEKVISDAVQPRRTVIVSLEGSESEILDRMKQKTRYNINLAEKKEVVVRPSSDIYEFHRMAVFTAERDMFGVHNHAYYQNFYDLFAATKSCELFSAYYQKKVLASLFVIKSGDTAFYLYGASYNVERNRMPTYLLQWKAMIWAKEKGCKYYDLWGIPDYDEEELEKSFTDKDAHDGLWGVYRFKRGFGGEIKRTVGAWDMIYNPKLYNLYAKVMKLRKGSAA